MAAFRVSLSRHRLLRQPPRADVVEDQDDPADLGPSRPIGAAESSIAISAPSRAIRTLWSDRPTTISPSRGPWRPGSRPARRVSSSIDVEDLVERLPGASSWVQPVRVSAIGFMNSTAPLVIGGDHGVADAGEGHAEPLPLFEELLLDAHPPLDLAVELASIF